MLRKYGVAAPTAVLAALDDIGNETPPADSLGLAGVETDDHRPRPRRALRCRPRGRPARDTWSWILATNYRRKRAIWAQATQPSRGGYPSTANGGRNHFSSETTVAVQNPEGKGGRNLEYLLGLAIALNGAAGISALACDTDGNRRNRGRCRRDNRARTRLKRARAARTRSGGASPHHNAYLFFRALGDLRRDRADCEPTSTSSG